MTFQHKTRLKIWLVLIAVFILGSLTGAALDAAYRLRLSHMREGGHGMHGEHEALFEHLRHELNLNDQQAAQVQVILDEARQEFHQLQGEARPRFDSVRLKANERIRGILTPEQQAKFDASIAEHNSKRRAGATNKD